MLSEDFSIKISAEGSVAFEGEFSQKLRLAQDQRTLFWLCSSTSGLAYTFQEKDKHLQCLVRAA